MILILKRTKIVKLSFYKKISKMNLKIIYSELVLILIISCSNCGYPSRQEMYENRANPVMHMLQELKNQEEQKLIKIINSGLQSYGAIAKSIALFGNGLSFFNAHHTLVVIYYPETFKGYKYRLLEVVKNGFHEHMIISILLHLNFK